MDNLKNVSALVKDILEQDRKARNTDNHLYLKVLEYYSVKYGLDISTMTVPELLKELDQHILPGFETVRRSRQKVQASYPELAPAENIRRKRTENESYYKNFALDEV